MEKSHWFFKMVFVVFVFAMIDHVANIKQDIASLRGQIATLMGKPYVDNSAVIGEHEFAFETKEGKPIYSIAGIHFIRQGAVLIPVDFAGEVIDSDFKFHEIYHDAEINHPVGKFGAISYVLDKNGRKISDGFHGFFLKNGKLWGELGAMGRPVVLKN